MLPDLLLKATEVDDLVEATGRRSVVLNTEERA